MKKNIKILLLTLVSVLLLFLVACGTFDSIFFEKAPRTTYVQGQDLDFTDTVLVAMKKDKQEPVDLTSEDVVITGYDKNTLGKQTVTFTYKEATTTLTVTVIPRIAFEGVVTDYFVKDTINRAEGRIRVADDKGKTTTVNFNSDQITVEGFDSTTAGAKTVTVKYGGYSATYTANVYNVDSVVLSKRPKKTLYNSHDTEFDVTGAYFTVTANNGALSRYVTLTADMIKDFDPSAATVENLVNRLPQTVKIEYLGHVENFDISIQYSAVSYMKDVAKSIENVTDPKKCDAKNAEQALLALEEYIKLSDSNQKLVDEDDTEKIALVAAYYGYERFKQLTDEYAESFILSKTEAYEDEYDKQGKYYGVFSLTLESYQAAKDALDSLKSEDGKEIDKLAGVLRTIEKEFPDLEIDGKNMDEYLCTVFSEGGIDLISGLLKLMVEIYDELSAVPENWTAEQLIDYKANIKKAVIAITDSDYNPFKATVSLEIFKMLSKWREKDDIFYIISAYYLTHEPDEYVSAIWEKVPLPGDLNDLYLAISYGLRVTNNLRVGTDTTPFMYYYRIAKNISEDVKNGDDQLEKDVYAKLSFDYLMRSYFYTGENVNNIAYVYHASSLVGNEKAEAFFEKYIDLVYRLYNEPDFDFTATDVVAASTALMEEFMTLSASERYSICAMIQCDYRSSVLEESIFTCIMEDGEINAYNLFTRFILNAYNSTLSAEGFEVFKKLLVATENASLYNFRVDGADAFIEEMDGIATSMAALSGSERVKLKLLFADVYTVYEELKAPKSVDLTGYEDKFEELTTLIHRFFEIDHYIAEMTDVERKWSIYALLSANYEKARALADEILQIDDEDVSYYFYYTKHTFNTDLEDDDEDKDFSCSFDLMLEQMATIRTQVLLDTNISLQYKEIEEGEIEEDYMTEVNAFYVFDISTIGTFLADAYDIMWAQFEEKAAELDPSYVLSVMVKTRDFNANTWLAFKALHINVLYYEGVLAALSDTVSEDVYALLEKLTAAEDAYAAYIAEGFSKNLAAYEEAIDALTAAYEDLADKDSFADFIEIYNDLLADYEEIKAEEDGDSTEE